MKISKKLIEIIDAHGIASIDKHYWLRSPAEDAKLSKTLVMNVMGKTVAWPTDQEVSEVLGRQPHLLEETLNTTTIEEAEVEEEAVDGRVRPERHVQICGQTEEGDGGGSGWGVMWVVRRGKEK